MKDTPATPDHSVESPSGRYVLTVSKDHDGQAEVLRFEVRDPAGTALFAAPDLFAARHRTYFLWDEEDRVWVYSGDVGAFYWVEDPDKTWTRHTYLPGSSVQAPLFLRKTLPRWFPSR